MPSRSSIYVEIPIRATVEALWSRIQDPKLHDQWDLRLSRIERQPRTDEAEAQRFLYSTCIGFWLEIDGEGESVGLRD